MKKTRLFAGPLGEMFHRLLLCGLVCAAVPGVISFFVPLISALRPASSADSAALSSARELLTVIQSLWIPVMYVAGLALPYTVFSWLNKRRACDCLHALPVASAHLFGLQLAAVFGWLAAVFFSSGLLFTVSCLLFGAPMTGLLPALLPLMLELIVGACLIAACAAAACALTGTRLSNLVVTVIFLFLPTLLYGGEALAIYARAEIVPFSENGLLLPVLDNLSVLPPEGRSLFKYVFGSVLLEENVSWLEPTGVSLLYTAFWSALGTWFYVRRRSESAGSAAPGRAVQHLIRCALVSPIFLIPVFIFSANRMNWTSVLEESGGKAVIVALLVFAAVVYFLYEIISTRSFRRLLPAAAVFLILPLLAGLVWTGTAAVSDAMLRRLPDRSELQHIQLLPGTSYSSSGAPSYTQLQVADVDFDRPKMLEVCHDLLAYNIETVLSDSSSLTGSRYYVCFKTTAGSFTRRLYSGSFDRQLLSALLEEESMTEAMRRTPQADEILSLTLSRFGGAELPADQLEELWRLQRAEIEGFSPTALLTYFGYTVSETEVYDVPTLQITGMTADGRPFISTYRLTGQAKTRCLQLIDQYSLKILRTLCSRLLDGQITWDGYAVLNGQEIPLGNSEKDDYFLASFAAVKVAEALTAQGDSLRIADEGESSLRLYVLTGADLTERGNAAAAHKIFREISVYLPEEVLASLAGSLSGSGQ